MNATRSTRPPVSPPDAGESNINGSVLAAPALSSAKRRSLRADAHHLDPVVMIGDAGLTGAVIAEANRALDTHQLIKIRVLGDDREARTRMMGELCAALGCAPVQIIGKLLVVWRPAKAVRQDTGFVPKKEAAQRAEAPAARAGKPVVKATRPPARPARDAVSQRSSRTKPTTGRPSAARSGKTGVDGPFRASGSKPAAGSGLRGGSGRPSGARPGSTRSDSARPDSGRARPGRPGSGATQRASGPARSSGSSRAGPDRSAAPRNAGTTRAASTGRKPGTGKLPPKKR